MEVNETCPQVLTESELEHSDDVIGWINLIKQIVACTGIMANLLSLVMLPKKRETNKQTYRQKYNKTDRKTDRKTTRRLKDRKTLKQKHRNTEDRKIERQKNRKTEKQKGRKTE
jgi:hypothetical protein